MWKRLEQAENGRPMIVGAGIGSKMHWATRAYFLFDEWRLACKGYNGSPLSSNRGGSLPRRTDRGKHHRNPEPIKHKIRHYYFFFLRLDLDFPAAERAIATACFWG